jgi:hypothetical protein
MTPWVNIRHSAPEILAGEALYGFVIMISFSAEKVIVI